ncbi:G protein-activated inward rectifier potassium channel 3-like [Paramacrobiotus metropolitanus]|uniref:G protein-activated inward rectifier potassium channel 3-like n=1 Tax=Paramacrobiotus metropolitanus TaxID=2943436 RepID=UPI002446419D|nr:G protein-activated inward rectifier potassium channel 3-like [Paramacrobiotus metropolitanus]
MGRNAKFFTQSDGWESDSQSTPIAHAALTPHPATTSINGSMGNSGNAVYRFGKRVIGQRHNSGTSTFRSRLLLKHGTYNITGKNIPQRRVRLVSDLWNTLIDLKWRFILILFMLSFVISWALFAVIFYVIASAHGDLERSNQEDWKPCIKNLESFTAAFLYSVESQHTIGYGFRYTTEECAEAIIFMCLQAAVGVALQAFMVGVVFAKVQLPKKRAQTLLFSEKAVICSRDGKLCLLFRIGNMRRSLIIQSSVRAQLVHHRKTIEGELLPFHQHEMSIQLDSMSGSAFLAWPVTACHVITPTSPIYDLSRKSLERAKFEMIVILEGVIESTGMVTQARTSYVPEEILWGHRFSRLLTYRKESGQYVVDFDRFQAVEFVPNMPDCSARELDMIKHASVPDNYQDEQQNDGRAAAENTPPSPSLQRAVSAVGMHSPSAIVPGLNDPGHSSHSVVPDSLSPRRTSVQFSAPVIRVHDAHYHDKMEY